MLKQFNHVLYTAITIVLMCACGDDEAPVVPESTDYKITIPAYLGDVPDSPSDNTLTKNGVALGRMLFYEKILSRDSSLSCGSCHKQEFGFSDGLTFSTGIDDQIVDRNSMAISNALWQQFFFWDGRAATLEEQALKPIENSKEMDLDPLVAVARLQATSNYPGLFCEAFGSDSITTENLAKAISQFERTLVSTNSRYDRFKMGEETFTASEQLGEQLFYIHPEAGTTRGANCGDCHASFLQMDALFHNNGLDENPSDKGLGKVTFDPNDFGKFKTPSLRNIELTGPYMHDGRFETLEEVLNHYNEHVKLGTTTDPLLLASNEENAAPELRLTDEEKTAIIDFLKTLTDNEFITTPAFSDPFEE